MKFSTFIMRCGGSDAQRADVASFELVRARSAGSRLTPGRATRRWTSGSTDERQARRRQGAGRFDSTVDAQQIVEQPGTDLRNVRSSTEPERAVLDFDESCHFWQRPCVSKLHHSALTRCDARKPSVTTGGNWPILRVSGQAA